MTELKRSITIETVGRRNKQQILKDFVRPAASTITSSPITSTPGSGGSGTDAGCSPGNTTGVTIGSTTSTNCDGYVLHETSVDYTDFEECGWFTPQYGTRTRLRISDHGPCYFGGTVNPSAFPYSCQDHPFPSTSNFPQSHLYVGVDANANNGFGETVNSGADGGGVTTTVNRSYFVVNPPPNATSCKLSMWLVANVDWVVKVGYTHETIVGSNVDYTKVWANGEWPQYYEPNYEIVGSGGPTSSNNIAPYPWEDPPVLTNVAFPVRADQPFWIALHRINEYSQPPVGRLDFVRAWSYGRTLIGDEVPDAWMNFYGNSSGAVIGYYDTDTDSAMVLTPGSTVSTKLIQDPTNVSRWYPQAGADHVKNYFEVYFDGVLAMPLYHYTIIAGAVVTTLSSPIEVTARWVVK